MTGSRERIRDQKVCFSRHLLRVPPPNWLRHAFPPATLSVSVPRICARICKTHSRGLRRVPPKVSKFSPFTAHPTQHNRMYKSTRVLIPIATCQMPACISSQLRTYKSFSSISASMAANCSRCPRSHRTVFFTSICGQAMSGVALSLASSVKASTRRCSAVSPSGADSANSPPSMSSQLLAKSRLAFIRVLCWLTRASSSPASTSSSSCAQPAGVVSEVIHINKCPYWCCSK